MEPTPSLLSTQEPRPRKKLRTLFDLLIVTVATLLPLALVLQIWNVNLQVPFTYSGDATFYAMLVDDIRHHGWFLTNSSFGAPFTQELYDLPHGADNLQLLILKFLGWITGNTITAINVYYLLTFVFVSCVAFLVLRKLGCARPTSVIFAVLYSFLPYHFVRGTNHLFLSGYYLVPLAVLLILTTMGEDPPFTKPNEAGVLKFRPMSWRSLGWLIACAGIASTGVYYAAFTIVLLSVLGIITALVQRSSARLLAIIALVVALGSFFFLSVSPTLHYWARHGTDPAVAQRSPGETELYGLQISRLVSPRSGHRIHELSTLGDKANNTPITSEAGQNLGLIGALGFLGLLGIGVATLINRRRDIDDAEEPATPIVTLRNLAAITIVSIAFGVIGGFSLILSALGLRDIRSWNRISVFIGFCALAAAALFWDRFTTPKTGRKGIALLCGLALLSVGILGLLDQTSLSDHPRQSTIKKEFSSDRIFVKTIDQRLANNASVFELPVISFPEAKPVGGISPYDPARFVLFSNNLRWSYGGMRGRVPDWQSKVEQLDAQGMTNTLVASGFQGLVIDRRGYQDNAISIEIALESVLDETPMISDDHTLSFFNLTQYGRSLKAQLGPDQFHKLETTILNVPPAKKPI